MENSVGHSSSDEDSDIAQKIIAKALQRGSLLGRKPLIGRRPDLIKNVFANRSLHNGSNIQATPKKNRSTFMEITSPVAKSPAIKAIKDETQSFPASNKQFEDEDVIIVNNTTYKRLKTFGKGGSSVVYQVFDVCTKTIHAIKVVSLPKDDLETRMSYRNEISILRRLNESRRVIKLFEFEESESQVKLVIEAGGPDLMEVLKRARQSQTSLPPFTIKHYWQEMLLAVKEIHSKGIIHSDLKPANFLFVGELIKLIDFGIASCTQDDRTSIFKENPCGTINYMSPESLIFCGSSPDKQIVKINSKSDIWSLGCILYSLVYGKPPFAHISNCVAKVSVIANPKTEIAFPTILDVKLMDVLKRCLRFDPQMRPSVGELLSHPFLTQI